MKNVPLFPTLNQITIKDKFPIPIIDDLLDDLHEVYFSTKLYLHLGYHHILKKEEEIHDTSFHIREGSYKFLVMPFGLCNTPSTFQSHMNKIVKPYIQAFFLLFFNDTLIYSKPYDVHFKHVTQVLKLLQDHHLFVKKTKCSFGVAQVEYLGHIVGRDGVCVHPNKIKYM